MIETQKKTQEELLPVDPNTKRPRTPVQQPGYYPGFSTLSQKNYWDEATRRLIEDRVYNIPQIRFFNAQQSELMQAIADRIVPQDDRLPEYRIPIVPYIDERLQKNEIDGYRFEDMPPDREAYRLGLYAIDETAYAICHKPFLDLGPLERDHVLKSIHDGDKVAAHDIWSRMSIGRFWQLLVQDCVTQFYAHPWAWDEIGFGGPAYPRAYMRLEGGQPEPWEVDEKRYEWEAPLTSISDAFEESGAGSDTTHVGQGGTH